MIASSSWRRRAHRWLVRCRGPGQGRPRRARSRRRPGRRWRRRGRERACVSRRASRASEPMRSSADGADADAQPDDSLAEEPCQDDPTQVAGDDARPVVMDQAAAGQDQGVGAPQAAQRGTIRHETRRRDAPCLGKRGHRLRPGAADDRSDRLRLAQEGLDAGQDGLIAEVRESLVSDREQPRPAPAGAEAAHGSRSRIRISTILSAACPSP